MLQEIQISVVIPTYNRSRYLDKCLDSLFKQNYPTQNYEVIVIDDNSNDDTQEVLEKYTQKYHNLQIVINKENKGPYYSRNRGVGISKGRVIAFTDSDCVLPPDWLQKIEKRFGNSTIVCVQGTQKCSGKWGKYMEEGTYFLKMLKARSALDTKNLMIHRDLIKKYRFVGSMFSGGDIEFSHRLFRDNVNIIYDPNIFIEHVTYNFSEVISKGKKWGEGEAFMCNKYGWKPVNPKFKLPIPILFLLYFGGFFYFLLKSKSIRGAFARSITTFLRAVFFKKNIKDQAMKKGDKP